MRRVPRQHRVARKIEDTVNSARMYAPRVFPTYIRCRLSQLRQHTFIDAWVSLTANTRPVGTRREAMAYGYTRYFVYRCTAVPETTCAIHTMKQGTMTQA